MTTIQRLQEWFASQCDGDWEHGEGITIETLDNPGWSVDIELSGTPLEERDFESVQIERSEHDWVHVTSTGDKLKIRCGPKNLEEGLIFFCDWAGIER
jgi:hypothetical protein